MMEAVKEKVKLKRYPEYKDSGLDWLGEIPKDWQLKRANYVFDIIDERSKTGKEELLSVSEHHGVKKRSESTVNMFMAESYKGYKLCYPGDLVINSLWAWSRGLGFSSLKGIVSTAYSVFRPDHEKYDHKYLHYLLRTRKYVAQYLIASKGIWISRLQLSDWAFLRIPILSPPKEEQTAIAHFLDRKTEQIDQAIEIKQKQIELLKERRQILIHNAVTRGLNPDVPLKPSGVDWIGDIPEHWEVKKIKYSAKIFRGKFTHRPRNDQRLYGGEYPFFQTGDVANATKYLVDYKQTLNEKGLSVSTLIPKGTVVITIAANIGDIAILGIDACFPDSIVGFEPFEFIKNDFLYYSLSAMKTQFMRSTIKNTQMNLNIDRIGNNFILIPPKQEQESIIDYLNSNSSKFDRLINRKEKEIEKLEEYKTTLINSAVTGKTKVS